MLSTVGFSVGITARAKADENCFNERELPAFLSGGTSAKPAGYIVRQKQQPEVIDALPLAVKTPPGKAVTKSKSQETTSPRQGAKEAKEAAPEKSEKMQRKRRDKVNRGSAGAAGSKEPKQTLLTVSI